MSGADRFETHAGTSEFTLRPPHDIHLPREGGDGSVVVALHGQGMNPAVFARHVLPAVPTGAAALLPQAPLPFELRRPGKRMMQGNGWYIYLGDDAQFVRSMQRTEEWLLRLVADAVAKHGLDARRVALLGFSQGGYLAGYVGLRNPGVFDRLVVAGARMKDEVLGDAARAAASAHPSFRILDVHGEQDESVSVDAVRTSADTIRAAGVCVDFRTYTAGHAVLKDDACRTDVRAFLSR